MLVPLYDENPTRRWPLVTAGIISINLLVFMLSLGLEPHRLSLVHARYGFVPQRLEQLFDSELVIPVNISAPTEEVPHSSARSRPDQEQYFLLEPRPSEILLSLLTAMFLHAGWMHVAGNMWFFWVFGNNIEDRLGHVFFLLLYLGGGLLASLCHWIMTPTSHATIPVVGASGAVAATLGAYAVTYPTHRVRCVLLLCLPFLVSLPALVVLGVWIGIQLFSALNGLGVNVDGNVAWWAHIGGFAAGATFMPLLTSKIPPPPTPQPITDTPKQLFIPTRSTSEIGIEWKRPRVEHNDPRIPHNDPGIRWLDET